MSCEVAALPFKVHANYQQLHINCILVKLRGVIFKRTYFIRIIKLEIKNRPLNTVFINTSISQMGANHINLRATSFAITNLEK